LESPQNPAATYIARPEFFQQLNGFSRRHLRFMIDNL
jgi:hypothetical protein